MKIPKHKVCATEGCVQMKLCKVVSGQRSRIKLSGKSGEERGIERTKWERHSDGVERKTGTSKLNEYNRHPEPYKQNCTGQKLTIVKCVR